MCLAYLDGLDALIEYYVPAARHYPIALGIYVLFAIAPFLGLMLIWRKMRRGRNK